MAAIQVKLAKQILFGTGGHHLILPRSEFQTMGHVAEVIESV
jgi:hypothetical protein